MYHSYFLSYSVFVFAVHWELAPWVTSETEANLQSQIDPNNFRSSTVTILLQVGPHPPMINFHKFLEQGIKRIDALPFAEKCQNTEGF